MQAGDIDWENRTIGYTRRKTRSVALVHFGDEVEAVLRTLPADGPLFPYLRTVREPERPFVILSQPGLCDPSRAPEGCSTAWAYCLVPHGSTVDMTDRMERQIERFAPGFRDRVLARRASSCAQLEAENPNLVGGDISGGVMDWRQILARPILSSTPYRIPVPGLYLSSASTPPGGGVHGMCGFHAAEAALRDLRRRGPRPGYSAARSR